MAVIVAASDVIVVSGTISSFFKLPSFLEIATSDLGSDSAIRSRPVSVARKIVLNPAF